MAQIASATYGVVTRARLLDAGVTAYEIRRRVRTGGLLREYPGVYRVGHRAPSTEARYLAAVLAAGQGAVLSGRGAAHLLGLVKGTPPPPELIARTERRIAGIKTHRSRVFDAREAASFKGIPVTTVPRTLVDLRPSSPSTHSLAPATRPESGMERRQPPSKACLGGGPTAPERESSAASSMETST